MAEAIKTLKSAAAAINDVADRLAETANENHSAPAKSDAAAEKHTYTLEEVRAVLAEKSANGHTEEVRGLILKYGAKKLSDVDPTHYEALVRDAEALSNDED